MVKILSKFHSNYLSPNLHEGKQMEIPKKILVDIPIDKGGHIKSAGAKGEKYMY